MATLVYADGQIPLSTDMLINLSGQAPVVELVDEQGLGKESDPAKIDHFAVPVLKNCPCPCTIV